MQVIPLDRLDYAALMEPGDVVAWPQGPGEPLALTEALVAQGPGLREPALMFGLTQSETLQTSRWCRCGRCPRAATPWA